MAKRSKPETNVSPDDEAACFQEYSEKRGAIARIQQSIATMLERYKKMGVDTKAIKIAYAESQKEEPGADLREGIALMARLKIISFDADGQGSFLRGLEVSPASEDALRLIALTKVQSDGFDTGMAGGLKDSNPWDAGTEPHVAWLEAWHEGHRERLKADPSLATVTQASPRKRKAKEEVIH
jgi:ribosome modulation factor